MTRFGKQLHDLFDEALRMPPEDRSRFVASIRTDNPRLASALSSLIQHDEAAPDAFLKCDAGAVVPSVDDIPIPDSIGRYRVLREIGRGGMGVVYEAEQENPQRRVALKVIRQELGSPQRIRRFRYEAHVLGQLQHSGIAQIFEAGSAIVGQSELPFFAMELVDGVPLDRAAEGLSVRDKVQLMARVCDAVEHAHQKGVIHRDLKPANILVVTNDRAGRQEGGTARSGDRHFVEESGTGGSIDSPVGEPSMESAMATEQDNSKSCHPSPDAPKTGHGIGAPRTRTSTVCDAIGQPKILDFGIARLTDVDVMTVSMQTDAGQLIGTIPYMSPEQVSGDVQLLDTRSDVYSLGVVLYQLLTGELPYRIKNRSVAEAVRTICEEEPGRLSATDSSLRGDLEAIVAKVLEKNVERRYQSAGALASDLRRYLTDEPIEARPAGAFYQARKFARRNKALVGGLAVAVIALAVGFGAALYGFVTASRERDEKEIALKEQQAALEVSEGVTDFLQSMFASADPGLGSRDMTVKQILDRASRKVGDQFPNAPQVETRLRTTIGRTYLMLGEYDKAEEQFLILLDLYPREFGPGSAPEYDTLSALSGVYYRQGRIEEAIDAGKKAMEGLRKQLGSDDPRVAASIGTYAFMLSLVGRFEEARTLLAEAVALRKKTNNENDLKLLGLRNTLATIHIRLHEDAAAEEILREVYEQARSIYGDEHPETAFYMSNLGSALMSRAPAEAEKLIRGAFEIQRRTLGEAHARTLLSMHNLAESLFRIGRVPAGMELLKHGIAISKAAHGDADPSTRMLVTRFEERLAAGAGETDASTKTE